MSTPSFHHSILLPSEKWAPHQIPPATHFTVLTEEPTAQLPVENTGGEVQAQRTGPGIMQKKILDLGVVMIFPQVHLRKPCYDFTFL